MKLRLLLLVIMVLTVSCTVVNREYPVIINVSDNSTVEFTVKIEAAVEKGSEVDSNAEVTTDAELDIAP